MLAVFSAPGDEDARVLATARWDGVRAEVEADDDDRGAAVAKAFRATPVVTDDASYRGPGTQGAVQIQPGTLAWFRAAALVRAPAETGMVVRLVPGLTEGGFDPAAGYRTFADQMARLDAAARPRR